MSEMQTIVETEQLVIRHLPGRGKVMVVAFTGIGHAMGKIQKEEFVRIGSQGAMNHVLFVTDRQRSWYSGAGLRTAIAEQILRMRDALGIETVLTLGNSMGGHGAFLFARDIGARTAIAFAPQYSMRPATLTERRWSEFRQFMVDDDLADLSDGMGGETSYFAIFGQEDKSDILHRDLMNSESPALVLSIAGSGHDVAAWLKEIGVLTDLVQAMFADDVPAISALLEGRGAIMPKPAGISARGSAHV